jgi:hypothetical protein
MIRFVICGLATPALAAGLVLLAFAQVAAAAPEQQTLLTVVTVVAAEEHCADIEVDAARLSRLMDDAGISVTDVDQHGPNKTTLTHVINDVLATYQQSPTQFCSKAWDIYGALELLRRR